MEAIPQDFENIWGIDRKMGYLTHMSANMEIKLIRSKLLQCVDNKHILLRLNIYTLFNCQIIGQHTQKLWETPNINDKVTRSIVYMLTTGMSVVSNL